MSKINVDEELVNQGTRKTPKPKAEACWNLDQFDAAVRYSKAGLAVVNKVLRNGLYSPWEYQPPQYAYERYIRNQMDLT